jgi:sugar-specific transcriptional regulator TrmB
MIPQLKKLGFSENEARIYLATLELGEASVARIAQKARMKRTTVYGLMESLRERGLIKVIRNGNKTFYRAEDPRKLEEITAESARIAQSILPSLLAVANFIDQKPKMLYFEGIEGIKDLYRETLKYPRSRIHAWLSEGSFQSEGDWFDDAYRPKRKELKIFTQAILPETASTRAYHKHDQPDFHLTRLDSSGTLSIESDILIFGTHSIAILSWEEMTGVLIESKKIHDTLRSIFSVHWDSLGK